MRQATPQLRDLARQIFAREAKRSRAPGTLAEAMEVSCRRLHERLDPLIGAGGFRAILARALHLAKKESPLLQDVEVEEHPACALKGLQEVVKGRDASPANEAFALVLANIVWLLVTFIGEDIALGLIQEVWPEIETGAAGPISKEGKDR
jgi:hypothetical protein